MKRNTSNRVKRRMRLKQHIRKKVFGTPERPRLTVYRSLNSIYAQLIDDTRHRTILSVSSLTKSLKPELEKAKGKTEAAKIVGRAIAEEAKKKKIQAVVFDRNGYLYHGRVRALAEAVRESGIKV